MEPEVTGVAWWEKACRAPDDMDDVAGADPLVGVWGWLPPLVV